MSPRTVAAYRDAFVLFLDFAQAQLRKQPTEIRLEEITPALILSFLDHLEQERGNAVRTRNARLAALRAFLKFAGRRDVTALHAVEQPGGGVLLTTLDPEVARQLAVGRHHHLRIHQPRRANDLFHDLLRVLQLVRAGGCAGVNHLIDRLLEFLETSKGEASAAQLHPVIGHGASAADDDGPFLEPRFSDHDGERLLGGGLAGKEGIPVERGLGFLGPEDDPQPMHEIMDIIFEPVLVDRPYDPRDYNSIEKAMEIATIGFEHRLFKSPGHRVFLDRALLGLDAYLKQLGTVANYYRLFRECVRSVPEG